MGADRSPWRLMPATCALLQAAGVSAQELPHPDILAVGVWRRPDEKHPLAKGYQYTAPTKVHVKASRLGPSSRNRVHDVS